MERIASVAPYRFGQTIYFQEVERLLMTCLSLGLFIATMLAYTVALTVLP